MNRMTPHYDEPGTPAWHERRATCFNASDAPAMLGCDPNRSRTDLLDELVNGYTADPTRFQQRVFADGHEFEARARPLGEGIMGEDLNAIGGSVEWPGLERPLGASFDGLTFAWDHVWEHKQLNALLADSLPHKGPAGMALNNPANLPKLYRVQMEQQLMVSGAEDNLFTASKWDQAGDLVDERHVRYVSDPELRAEIVAGWKQLQEDRRTHQPKAHAERPQGEKPEDLGALVVQVEGRIVTSNLGAWRDAAMARIAGINRDLKTDEDFATAKATVTWLEDSEKKLKLLGEQVIGQMVDVNEVVTTLSSIREAMKRTRLDLGSAVTTRETEIRQEVARRGEAELAKHIVGLTTRIGRPLMPGAAHVLIAADFQKAIRSKRTVKSLNDAVDAEVARAKIAASAVADRIELNLRHLAGDECKDWQHLFSTGLDRVVILETEQFQMHCKGKIAEAREAEEKRRREREETEAQLARQAEQRAQANQQPAAGPVAGAAPAPAPSPAPGPAAVAPAPAVRVVEPDPFTAPVVPAGPPTLSVGAINARLGFTLTAALLAQLGFNGTKDRSATLFHEADFRRICRAISAHVERAAEVDYSQTREAA